MTIKVVTPESLSDTFRSLSTMLNIIAFEPDTSNDERNAVQMVAKCVEELADQLDKEAREGDDGGDDGS